MNATWSDQIPYMKQKESKQIFLTAANFNGHLLK